MARLCRAARGIRVTDHLEIDPAERKLATILSAALWIVGGAILLLYPLLPGASQTEHTPLTVIGTAAVIWGTLSLSIVRRRPLALVHLETAAALAAITAVVAMTGGAESPAWIYYLWVVLFGSYFYPQPVAILVVVGCILVESAPLVYDGNALSDGFVGQLMAASAGFATIGLAVTNGKELLRRLRVRAEIVAAEQAALRRVATAVVGGERPESIYRLAAREVAALLGGAAAAVLQLRADGAGVVLGIWSSDDVVPAAPGVAVALAPGGPLARAVASAGVVRFDVGPAGELDQVLGSGPAGIAGPIVLGGTVWGLVVVAASRPSQPSEAESDRLDAFCALLSTAVANLEDRARLAAEALTDSLTGLSNQRALQQRLAAELAAGARHRRTVSVAVLDIDHFKEINDTGGHAAGDEVLRQFAASLQAIARAGDTLGRNGGDEFMWIMPDTDSETARAAVQRARELISRTITQPLRVTTSAGICDTRSAPQAAELVRLADLALYASKAEGRNQVTVHASQPGSALARGGERQRAADDETAGGLRALLRALEAKDPATRAHSERVAELAGQLARVAGWPEQRVALLRDAALVHDVGKLGVADAVLCKRGSLTGRERRQMREHAELSARIAGGVLTAEQVGWIRLHHERPDGSGYPLGVGGDSIPEGAALIALADAFDVMTSGCSWSPRRSTRAALQECAALQGKQFSAAAVGALRALEGAGGLDDADEPELLVAVGQ